MRRRRAYESRLLVAGVALLVLGTSNVIIGHRKLVHYKAVVAEGRARGYFPDAGGRDRILRPLDDEGERYNIGRAKVDLYRVVMNGGFVLAGIGVLLTLVATIRLRIQRAAQPARADGPPRPRLDEGARGSVPDPPRHASATR